MNKKILFWISSDLTHFGLSKHFHEEHNFELYAIYDVTNNLKKYYEKQQIVKFKKVWYMHDHIQKNKQIVDLNYLKSIEKKYGINLSSLAFNERHFYRYNDYYTFTEDEVLKIIEQECKLFEKILDDIKPDFVFMLAPNFHYHQIFGVMCKNRNIKTSMLGFSRFGKRAILSSGFDKIDSMPNEVNSSGIERTPNELLDYLKGDDYYDDNINFSSNFMSSKSLMLKALFRYLTSSYENSNLYTYYGRTKLKSLLITTFVNLREKCREFFINKNLEQKISGDSHFLYFPLQLTQENGLLLAAPFHTNQLEVIRNICQSLPVGYKLYVKEHPVMFMRGWRPSSFYKKIMDLPNVKLFHPKFSHEQMLKNCSAVITISSTAGMEAAFYGKPSIVFVDVIYSMMSSVLKVDSTQQLPKIIRDALKTKVDMSDVNRFVNHMNKNSFKFDLFGILSAGSDHFHYGGFLHDVELNDQKILSFLKTYNSEFQLLFNEHKKSMPS